MRLSKRSAQDYRQTLWKNGAGITRELLVWPQSAGFDDFAWRISCAQVSCGSAFSQMMGVSRSLCVLDGVLLLTATGAEGQVHTRLDADAEFIHFDGAAQIWAEPEEVAVTDFNVMSRSAACRHEVQRIRVDASATIISSANHLIVYHAHGETISVELANQPTQNMTQGELILLSDINSAQTLKITGKATLFAIDIIQMENKNDA